MASITTWIRLEPRARDSEMTPGVEARVHDPLWLLARQWQLGELEGEDGGSAITARARLDVGQIRDWDQRTPLAALVEAMPRAAARPVPDVQRRAQTGRQLLRMLAGDRLGAHADAFLTAFPIAVAPEALDALDDAGRAFLAAVRGRVPDGIACAATLRTALPRLPGSLGIPPGLEDRVAAVCTRWLAWYDALELEPPQPAWRSDRVEYACTLPAAIGGEDVSLVATEHHGDDLAWWRFDVQPGAASAEPPQRVVSTSIPGTVAYQGMPARRYWELEDGGVDWGAVDAGPGDVARMLLVEFALVFSDDWLHIPIDLDAGTLARVASLVVTDTFDVQTRIRGAHELDGPASPWKLFTTSGAASPLLLVLPPPALLEGPALDEVEVFKDEASNLAWAIERRIGRADGAGGAPPAVPIVERAAAPGPRYRIGGDVPAALHPFRPQASAGVVTLRRAAIPGRAAGPQTLLVAETPAIAEEELAGRAIRVVERRRLARTSDGTLVTWRARRRELAPTGAAPALRFDRVENE